MIISVLWLNFNIFFNRSNGLKHGFEFQKAFKMSILGTTNIQS